MLIHDSTSLIPAFNKYYNIRMSVLRRGGGGGEGGGDA